MSKPGILSAGYGGYAENFSDHFFNDPVEVVHSVARIKARLGNPRALEWGKYQKFAPQDPADVGNWDMNGDGGAILYDNWEAAVDEAREDVAKLPPDHSLGHADPDNPSVKHTMLEHLDRAVTIALLEKHQVGRPNESGIPVSVVVKYQDKRWRRHRIRTKWDRRNNADPKYNCDRLTITMTCPNGGWIGTALWRDYDGSQGAFTRYTATYVVPPPPTNNVGQIIFIFNGLESIPNGTNVPAILQPVLQWTSEGGSEGTWAVRSWYVPANYEPSFSDMPDLDNAKAFNNLRTPAWTRATQVYPGDTLLGILEKHGNSWVSKFQKSAADIADSVLTVTNIAEFTYPVAVVEAYMPPKPGQRPDRVPNDGLVASVTMTDVSLTCVDGTPRPNWDTGTDAAKSPVEKGTNNLKRYSTVATFNDGTGTSMIQFTRKGSMATAKSPVWEGSTPSLWRRLLGIVGLR
jgi:hypothetical protein